MLKTRLAADDGWPATLPFLNALPDRSVVSIADGWTILCNPVLNKHLQKLKWAIYP